MTATTAAAAAVTTKATKFCGSCGRSFSWRASLASSWESARYCSKTCRSTRAMHNRVDRRIEASFLSLLLSGPTARSKITCEAVQEADGEERTAVSWRERYRRAARRLANVREVCEIERFEDGKWQLGDGKGSMRVWLREGKEEEAQRLAVELASAGVGGKEARASNDESDAEEPAVP